MAAVALATSVANAQTACPRQAEVDALEEQGRTLRGQNRDAEALALFQRAFALCRAPRALARIALAEAALGRWVDAETHLLEALARTDEPWVSSNQAALRAERETIASHLGDLDLPGAGEVAEVWIDNQRAGTWPTVRPLRVAAGSVTVEVRREGYSTVTRTVVVPARGLARESITMVQLARRASPSEGPQTPDARPSLDNGGAGVADSEGDRRRSRARSLRVGSISAAVLALASVGTGAAFLVLRNNAVEAWNNLPPPGPFTPLGAGCHADDERPECRSLQADIDTHTTVSAVAFVAGSALAAGSLALFVLSRRQEAPPTMAAACLPSPGALHCAWRF